MSEEQWYEIATTSRSRWRATYTEGLKESQTVPLTPTKPVYVPGVSGEKVTEKGINVQVSDSK